MRTFRDFDLMVNLPLRNEEVSFESHYTDLKAGLKALMEEGQVEENRCKTNFDDKMNDYKNYIDVMHKLQHPDCFEVNIKEWFFKDSAFHLPNNE